jgi:hypothetical protein
MHKTRGSRNEWELPSFQKLYTKSLRTSTVFERAFGRQSKNQDRSADHTRGPDESIGRPTSFLRFQNNEV